MRKHLEYQRKHEAIKNLETINLGEYEAEGEQNQLEKYFIRTSSYNDALRTSQYMIFVGRKGSGKTANFFRIAQELRNDPKQNAQVCIIQPVHYELEGVFQFFNLSISQAEKGNLVQSLWKFLIYTELALDTYKTLYSKPATILTKHENELLSYIDRTSFIKEDFSVRMEYAINKICGIDLSGSIMDRRRKVSQVLHDDVLSQLRILLGNVLNDKEKVVVLVDNLDKAWRVRDDLTKLAEFLFGLLDVGEAITAEFHKSDTRKQKVELVIIVFIRSDIFSYIRSHQQEQEKLHTTLINWNDSQLLLRVIEERFRSSLTGLETSEEIWEKFFTQSVKGIPTRQYIANHVLPRPRDVILFCKQARFHAINHEHVRIEEDDIIQAEQDYSQHTWFTLLSETKAQFPQIEELLTYFMGEEEIVTRERIEMLMEEAGIPKKNSNKIIDLLCEANFLGLEIDWHQFLFVYDERLKHRRTQARKSAKQIGVERYKINVPFHAFLEIKPSSESS